MNHEDFLKTTDKNLKTHSGCAPNIYVLTGVLDLLSHFYCIFLDVTMISPLKVHPSVCHNTVGRKMRRCCQRGSKSILKSNRL